MKDVNEKKIEFGMSPNNFQEDTRILKNCNYKGDYFCITFHSPIISKHVLPGQFVHLQLPYSPELILRRPFSIYNVNTKDETLSLIYKVIGKGSEALSELPINTKVNLLGPLGNGFPSAQNGDFIIIVAGGYGCASTYLVAKYAENPGCCVLGARTKDDILIEDEFKKTGFEIDITTNDGSYGHKGLVTDVLERKLGDIKNKRALIYACGPNAMLEAVGKMCRKFNTKSYLSYDMPMCCGVGACFTCVIKIKADTPDGWEYIRTCKYGPIFEAQEIYWE